MNEPNFATCMFECAESAKAVAKLNYTSAITHLDSAIDACPAEAIAWFLPLLSERRKYICELASAADAPNWQFWVREPRLEGAKTK